MSAHPEQLTLFAMPTMCPTWPQRGTLADKALALMLDGRSLDHPTFEAEERSWRLAAAVFCLRELGWPIQTDRRSEPTPTCPSRTIAMYYMRDRDLLVTVHFEPGWLQRSVLAIDWFDDDPDLH